MATDTQDKAIHQAADAAKRDLTAGADVRVPTGDEAGPGSRIDPFAARKAMFATADAKRDAEAAQGGTIQDAKLAELAKEAGIDLEALQRGHQGAPADATPPATDRTLHLNKDKTTQAASTQPSQSADERVTLTINGADITVAKRDVDRAGGAELYVRRRELDAEADRLARQSAQLQSELEAAKKLRENLQQGAQHPAGQGQDPANRAADPAAQSRTDSGNTGVDDEKLAERLADQIYSGDQDEAKKGVLELIRLTRQRGEPLDTKAIVQQVRTEMGAAPKAEGTQAATPAPRTVDPVIDRVNREINAMSLAEFPDLMKDKAGRAAAYERFKELVVKPENADRLAVDVAREACEEIEPRFVNRRDAIVERKRGLQSTSAASGALRDEPEAVQDASSIVEQMAAARRFGRRPQQ